MKIRKSLAGVAAGSLALAGIAVVSAPSAFAGTGTYATINCQIKNTALQPGGDTSAGGGTFDLSVSSNSPETGTSLTVTFDSNGWSPNNGGAAAIPAGTTSMDVTVSYRGTDYVLTSGKVNPGQPLDTAPIFPGGFTATGTIPAGSVTNPTANDITVKTMLVNGDAGTATSTPGDDNFDAFCRPGAAPARTGNTATFSSAAPSINEAIVVFGADYSFSSITNQASPTSARAGDVVTVSGGLFGTAGTPTVTVGGTPAAASTLSVNASGDLGGTFTVPAGLSNGNQNVVITNGAKSATKQLNILKDTPEGSLTAIEGSPGISVTFNGGSFNVGDTVTVTQLDAGGNTLAGAGNVVTGVANSNGSVSIPFQVLAGLESVGWSGSGAQDTIDFTPFADACTAEEDKNGDGDFLDAGEVTVCQTKQTVSAAVTPGKLQQALSNKVCTAADLNASGPFAGLMSGTYGVPGGGSAPFAAACTGTNADKTSIGLGSVQVKPTTQYLGGVLNTTAVEDARGVVDSNGWSLTATLSGPLTANGGKTISTSNIALGGISCVSTANIDPDGAGPTPTLNYSAPVTAGSGGIFGVGTGAIQLCANNGSTNPDNVGSPSGWTTQNTDSSGGQYAVNAKIQVTVNAFQAAGNYTTTLVTTLA